MRQHPAAMVIVLGILAGACGPAAQATGVAPTLSPASPAPVATTAPATAAPTAAPAATRPPLPVELQGKWQVKLAEGDIATLEISAAGYVVTRLDSAPGRLEADGDALVFSHGSKCAGEGRYSWSITGNTLHLASIGIDPCPFRADSLDGKDYVRLG